MRNYFWYIPGYNHPYLLAIKIKQHENNYSEPIERIREEEKILVKNLAKLELNKRKKNAVYAHLYRESNLHNFRVESAKQILMNTGDKRKVEEFLRDFPYEGDVDWFN